MNVLKKINRLPIKMWCEEIESNAMEQAINLSRLPFAFRHIALMPDCHMGYGMPIGGVLATKAVIIPNAVGVDIGCGMCAVKTNLTEIDTGVLKNIMGKIRQAIPVGFKKHKESKLHELLPPITELLSDSIVKKEYDNTRKSLGTLGGGNHFIEIQKGDDSYIWIMLHSGSRNLGKQVADYYNKVAVNLNKIWFSTVLKEWELAFLPLNSIEGVSYVREMNYCVDYALANRKDMIEQIKFIIAKECYGYTGMMYSEDLDSLFLKEINIAHNYASQENHFEQNVWVHRKGATLAREGIIGIIPGSQGTKSYIVKGLGNKESFMSCSHGAGRAMGRKQAKRELDLNSVVKDLDDKGIIHSIRKVDDLDEAPEAYKDISVVMKNQNDLVDVLVELTPLAVIKG